VRQDYVYLVLLEHVIFVWIALINHQVVICHLINHVQLVITVLLVNMKLLIVILLLIVNVKVAELSSAQPVLLLVFAALVCQAITLLVQAVFLIILYALIVTYYTVDPILPQSVNVDHAYQIIMRPQTVLLMQKLLA